MPGWVYEESNCLLWMQANYNCLASKFIIQKFMDTHINIQWTTRFWHGKRWTTNFAFSFDRYCDIDTWEMWITNEWVVIRLESQDMYIYVIYCYLIDSNWTSNGWFSILCVHHNQCWCANIEFQIREIALFND